MIGASSRYPRSTEEKSALDKLQRGVYLNRDLSKGQKIKLSDVFFSIPLLPNKMRVSDFKENLEADKDYKSLEAINEHTTPLKNESEILKINILHEVKALLNKANIKLGFPNNVEFSHHYGFDRFREYGAVIFDIVNREYCKKIIVMLPRQKHPYHRHFIKEETFQILHGELEITINGNSSLLKPCDQVTIEREQWHKFQTLNGVVFEEISTTSFEDDSYYYDELISKTLRERRKTKIDDFNF
jgi:N-acetylneuraminate synthase